MRIFTSALAAVAVLGLSACGSGPNPPGTAATRALDRAADTNVSGAYPSQSDGTRANPSGTAPARALDRAAGTNTSGAFPSQTDGTRANPPGTAATRALDRAAGTNTSGAYSGQSDGTAANPIATLNWVQPEPYPLGLHPCGAGSQAGLRRGCRQARAARATTWGTA